MAATSVHKKVLDQVVTDLRALNLDGIEDSRIVIVAVPEASPRDVEGFPCITISPIGTEQVGPGTNRSDDIGYPVVVAIYARGNEVNATPGGTALDKILYWREQIIDKYVHKRVSSITGSANAKITYWEPGPIIDVSAWYAKQMLVSILRMRAEIRKDRS